MKNTLYFKRLFLLSGFLVSLAILPSAKAQFRTASSQQRLTDFFKNFDENPAAAMGQIPPKWDSRGIQVVDDSRFSEEEITSKSFIEKKDLLRQDLCPKSEPGGPCQKISEIVPRQEINPNNRVDRFLEKTKEFSLLNLSTTSLQRGQVKMQPWSGDYWPTYRGGIASRYADQKFPASPTWKDYEKYFATMFDLTDYQNPQILRTLSPAEKYDLLVGDKTFGLTQYSIQNAKQSTNEKGEIESWFGICHGWAPAAMQIARPEKPVTVTLADNRQLTFFPDDLKALASLLWANAQFDVRFSGGRCNVKSPKLDDIGRIVDSECWDSNPASFHLILLNQLGTDLRSFVMDAAYDYQVWNQPVIGYKMTYFNPQTRKESSSLEETLIPIGEFTKDKFKKYRSSKAKKIVGVQMNVTYSVERSADHRELDSPEDDYSLNVEYYYDLEIDGDGQIIGGEWYNNAHPDFLWSPSAASKARAPNEYSNSTVWDGSQVLPQDLQQLARSASAGGYPLERVLSALFKRSQQE